MIRKTFAVIETKVLDEAQGIVEAWVNSTAIEDFQKDVMEAGCWADVIKAADAGETSYPAICWGHDWADIRGKVLSATEFPPGHADLPDAVKAAGAGALRIKGQYNLDKESGRDAFSDVKGGYVKQWSVGFIADQATVRWDKGRRHIGRVAEWPEVSNVLLGASPGTMTATAKHADAGDPAERKARAADRLERARSLLAGLKAEAAAGDPGKASCCDACKGAECPGCCAECCHGEAAKAGGGTPGDPPGVPALEGDEAVHNGPLMQVLDGINTLIAQEIAEGGYTEYGDIIRLCCLAQDAIRWAAGEQSEYGDYGYSIWDLFAAGHAALSSKVEPPDEPGEKAAPALPAWLKAAILATSEADPTSSQPPNPAHGEGDGLDWERRYVNRFAGGALGLHGWLQRDLHGEPDPERPPEGAADPVGPPDEWASRFTSPWRQQQ